MDPIPLVVYDQPHQFEPLLPQRNLETLALATRAVVDKAAQLKATAHEHTRNQLRELVRSMNSYYSNLIEGQSTHPVNIDRALRHDFSTKPDVARRQRLALAHIEAERELEAAKPPEAEALSSAFLLRAHSSLYGRLSEEDRRADGDRVVEPGKLRNEDVRVGRHQPPAWRSLQTFLARADAAYAKPWGYDALLYAIASAHHRMAWIHPFFDGNGRACRLQTHCALLPLSSGLWSVSRGLARNRTRYYEMLSNADMARQGDLDGRGNLSERMLWQWCSFFIEMCTDQVSFMSSMLDMNQLRERLRALVMLRMQSSAHADYKAEAVMPLQYVLVAGPMSRGEFAQMTGLASRTASRLISRLLSDGLLTSETERGPVGIGFPLNSLSTLFPNLYPEAATSHIAED